MQGLDSTLNPTSARILLADEFRGPTVTVVPSERRAGGGVMSASSGEKRRRRRERRFLQVNDTLSLRSTIVAVAAGFGLLAFQLARTLIA